MADAAEWTIDTWNRRLFDAVFGARGGLLSPVRRVNVSQAFVGQLAGAEPGNERRALEAFLASVRQRFPGGRGVFDRWSLSRPWDRGKEPPPFFANLYLSCIAASATEDTQDEGNFRRRLSHLLGISENVNRVTYDLPALWQDLDEWTNGPQAAAQGYRPLVLPDPRHETIIGYSKRLAFPGFRDLEWLARAMTEQHVDVASPIGDILNAVGRYRDRFSDSFRDEFLQFRRFAADADPRCVDTLFWDAFAEVTWQSQSPETLSEPRGILGMEIPDLQTPKLLLLPRTTSDLPEGGRTVRFDADVRYPCAVLSEDAWDVLVNESHPWLKYLSGRIVKGIDVGCLLFAQGDQVQWELTNALPWEGPVWFAVARRWLTELRRAGATLDKQPGAYAVAEANGWYLFGPVRYRPEQVVAFVSRVPAALKSLGLSGRTAPAQAIRLRDALRMPDGILCLRPRLPKVVAPGADAVTIRKLGEGAADLEIRLAPGEDGEFVIPVERGGALPAGDYRVARFTVGRATAVRDVHLVRTYTGSSAPLPPSKLKNWRVDGVRGQLALLDGEPEAGRFEAIDAVLSSRLKTDVRSATISTTAEWRPLDADLPEEWADLSETMVAWASQREGFSWQELTTMLRDGLGVRDDRAYQVIDTLEDNRALTRLYSRRWRGSTFFVRGPTAVMLRRSGKAECRIVGMTSRLWRNRLRSLVTRWGVRPDIAIAGRQSAVGAMRLTGESAAILSLLTEMDVPLEGETGTATCRPTDLLGERVPASFAPEIPEEILEPKQFRFAPRVTQASSPRWTLGRRQFERDQTAYVLYRDASPAWVTRSRRWAGFVWALCARASLVETDRSGMVVSRWPLPLPLSEMAILNGAGVCGSNWREEAPRTWHYAFGSPDMAVSSLKSWTTRGGAQEPLRFWLSALSVSRGAPDQETLQRWYRRR